MSLTEQNCVDIGITGDRASQDFHDRITGTTVPYAVHKDERTSKNPVDEFGNPFRDSDLRSYGKDLIGIVHGV